MISRFAPSSGAAGLQPAALVDLHLICRHYERSFDVRAELDALPPDSRITLGRLRHLAQGVGLTTRVRRCKWADLRRLGRKFPAVALLSGGETTVVSGFKPAAEGRQETVVLYRREANRFVDATAAEFMPEWTGELVLFERAGSAADSGRFGLGWFVREAFRFKTYLAMVFLSALFLNVLTVLTPLYFQVVVDKVLPREALTTLNSVTLGIVAVVLMEGWLTYRRAYFVALAGSKIDLRLNVKTFAHLIRLPLLFFQQSHAGVLAKHMQQTDQIREFLTGNLLLAALDAPLLLLLFGLLLFYSTTLSFIVFGFAAAIAVVVAVLVVPFGRRLNELYAAEGERNAFLIEQIVGIRTSKAHGIERQQLAAWEERCAESADRNCAVEVLSARAQAVIRTLERGMTVAVVFAGARLVIEHQLSIGSLVAFQMLAGLVTGPVIQLATMAHQYHKTRIAVQMLAGIMDHRPERL